MAQIVVPLLLLTTACQRPDSVQDEIHHLRGQTVPPSARLLNESNLTREGFSAKAAWEFEADWDWSKYTNWVAGELTGYRLVLREANRLRFSRQLPGDNFELQIVSLTAKRIRVDFCASPE